MNAVETRTLLPLRPIARNADALEKINGDVFKKINVTYILGSLRDGGAERYALQIMQKLDRRRFRPALILMEGVNLHRSDGWVTDRFVMNVPQGGNTRWLGRGVRFIRAIQASAVRLRLWNSDVVHAFLPGPSILGGMAAKLAKVPVVIGSRHSLVSLYRHGGGLASLADRLAFYLADTSIAPSEAVAEEMIRLGGCPGEKCRTLYNGVDTERFHPGLARTWRSDMGWNDEHVIFAMIANFRPCKGHSDFVAAAALIAGRHPEARFVMAGADQGLMPETMRLVRDSRLAPKTILLDSHPEPEKILAAIDVCICASTSEAFGLVIAEAMACGRPVIATDVGGIPEVVDDGATGFLVPARSPQAIADAAEKLFNRDLRDRMGLRGRARVENLFSLTRAVAGHEKLYTELYTERMERRSHSRFPSFR